MKVLVTGATGFIGKRLCQVLSARGDSVVRVVRDQRGFDNVAVGCVNALTDWQPALALDPEIIVHLAARVHIIDESRKNSLEAFRAVNVEGTLNLARQAASAKVRRFVYLSSIKVNGEFTGMNQPFQVDDTPDPRDAYALSKYEAEIGLNSLARTTGMEVVIIRPPLVYGPGVKANFFSMMQWLYRGVPLPLGAISNRRSLIALDNLVDLITTCIDHPVAVNQTFLVSDGEDLSTPELLCRLGSALGKPARLLYVAPVVLKGVATIFGRRDMARRLCNSLQVDIGKTREILGWSPPISVEKGLRQTAKAFLKLL